MRYKEYTVQVFDNGRVCWFNEKDQLHREDGPAVYSEKAGYKEFFLNGFFYTEDEYWAKLKPIRKMTLAEIEKEIGCKIEIVGDK